MKIIRDATTLFGMLERGKLNETMTQTLIQTQGDLADLAAMQPGRKFSATVKLELKLTAQNDTMMYDAKIPPVKMPELPRPSTVLFILEDGAVSTEHPQQTDWAGGPREIDHMRSTMTR